MKIPKIITIETKENTDNVLNQLKITIKKRADGREQNSLEYWVLKKYLMITYDEFDYPISIIKSESPDFIIECNKHKFGIEITEATSEYYQELLTYESKHPDLTFERCNLQYGKEYTKQELYSKLRNFNSPISGSGWSGFGPEISASYWSYDAYLKKLEKLIKWKYPKEIRILLYDNTPTGIIYPDKFNEYLCKKFSEESACKKIRCDILSKSGEYVITNIQYSLESKLIGNTENLFREL